MRFENPYMLFGLAALLVPLVLHFWHRRRAQVVPFAALDFLLQSHRRMAQRLHIRQWLLLVIRCLLTAGIPLALAKPYLAYQAEGPKLSAEPTSVVLVIDDSFSMSYRLGEETLLDRAIEQARVVMNELPPFCNVALVTCSAPPRTLTDGLTFDHHFVLKALQTITATYRSTDIVAAMLTAERLLSGSRLMHRVVILLTDLASGGKSDLRVPWTTRRPPQVQVIDVANGRPLPNRAIRDTQVRLAANRFGRAELQVTVANFSPELWHDLVTVRAGGRLSTGYLQVAPWSTASKEFSLDAALTYGTVEIPPDDLQDDNRRAFVIRPAADLRVLIVNGAPRNVQYLDETFFVTRALAPKSEVNTGVALMVMTPDQVTAKQIQMIDVIILANVAQVTAELSNVLESFVRAGGGLLVTAGDNFTPAAAQAIADLLPFSVRSVEKVAARGLLQAAHIAPPLPAHSLFEPFRAQPDSSLFAAEIQRFLLLDAQTVGNGQVLASLTNGAPFLAEKSLGDGRVLMLTTTIDRDWTDLPIHPAFVPLMLNMVRYLAVQLATTPAQQADDIGSTVRLRAKRGVQHMIVRAPDGASQEFEGSKLARREIPFAKTDVPGIYEVESMIGKPDSHSERTVFAIHIDPKEMDTTRLDLAAVRMALAGSPQVQETAQDAQTWEASEVGTELWPWVIIALLGLLFFETFLFWQR